MMCFGGNVKQLMVRLHYRFKQDMYQINTWKESMTILDCRAAQILHRNAISKLQGRHNSFPEIIPAVIPSNIPKCIGSRMF